MIISIFDLARRAGWLHGLAGLGLLAGPMACEASQVLTQEDATATVLANGFRLVARTEPAKANRNPAAWASAEPVSWDVWAVKDGIAYRVTIDAGTGDLVKAAPAVEDD